MGMKHEKSDNLYILGGFINIWREGLARTGRVAGMKAGAVVRPQLRAEHIAGP